MGDRSIYIQALYIFFFYSYQVSRIRHEASSHALTHTACNVMYRPVVVSVSGPTSDRMVGVGPLSSPVVTSSYRLRPIVITGLSFSPFSQCSDLSRTDRRVLCMRVGHRDEGRIARRHSTVESILSVKIVARTWNPFKCCVGKSLAQISTRLTMALKWLEIWPAFLRFAAISLR